MPLSKAKTVRPSAAINDTVSTEPPDPCPAAPDVLPAAGPKGSPGVRGGVGSGAFEVAGLALGFCR